MRLVVKSPQVDRAFSLDEPCPCVMADGLANAFHSQFWLETDARPMRDRCET
jgi:hypothetical protein